MTFNTGVPGIGCRDHDHDHDHGLCDPYLVSVIGAAAHLKNGHQILNRLQPETRRSQILATTTVILDEGVPMWAASTMTLDEGVPHLGYINLDFRRRCTPCGLHQP